MDQLSAMRVFIRVVETGNFTRAADTLSIPKATVTNLIQGLEAHLRTKLLNRTTRRVMVTTDGALYYERAAQIVSELEELDGSLTNSQSLPTGRLRVEMAGAFADSIVVPALCDFYNRYPDIRIDLGVAQAPGFLVRDAIAKGDLVRVLPEWNREPLPLYVVYPPNRHLSNKVLVFVDWLAKLLVDAKLNGG